MIHPSTRIQFINDEIGYGIFATAFIPKGSIVYVKDALEQEFSPEAYASYASDMQEVIEKYSYIDERGYRILSWDLAKYVNHCCQCNTMSTGYGFEIAIRDIQEGEEITDEYGIFNLEYEMSLSCDKDNCRCAIRQQDLLQNYDKWDEQLKGALGDVFSIAQPLLSLLDEETINALEDFLKDERHYRSVLTLRYQSANGHVIPLRRA